MATKKSTNCCNFPKPIDNDFLVGHDDILNEFMRAWNTREEYPIHPVWMLVGPRGIGKATLAYKIARHVYGNVGDFFILNLENNIDKNNNPKPDGKSISIYTVRALIERMHMSSMSGNWRVILIDSVDDLNTDSSNALLKLLEEPPEKTLFLLIVHQLANVLPTIRSRARVEKMRPLTMAQLRTLCDRFIPNADVSDEMLRLANGSFGQIANLKSMGGDVIYDELMECLNNPRASSADVMAIAKKLAPMPELYNILLDAIASLGMAELYPTTVRAIADMTRVNLEPETGLFKIIMDIKKCLQTHTVI